MWPSAHLGRASRARRVEFDPVDEPFQTNGVCSMTAFSTGQGATAEAKRQRAPESPVAGRVQPPRWRDTRLALGVLLILVSVVAGSRVVAGAQRVEQAWALQHDLAAGTTLQAADLRLVEVRLDAVGTNYVRAADADPAGRVLSRPVTSGELLPVAALQPADAATMSAVTVPVERFHYPSGLDRGQLVDVYVTAKTASGTGQGAPERVLADVLVSGVDRDGSRFGSAGSVAGVVLSVDPDDVGRLVAAVRAGALDLVAAGR